MKLSKLKIYYLYNHVFIWFKNRCLTYFLVILHYFVANAICDQEREYRKLAWNTIISRFESSLVR